MTNTPLSSGQLDKAFDGCTPFLVLVDRALEEAEENVRKLRLVRSQIKNELLGENHSGLKQAMDNSGMSLDTQLETALEEELKNTK